MAQMFQMDLPVSASAGVPLTGLAMIIGLDQVLERFRTSLNVTGDLVGCVILDRFLPAEPSRDAEREHEQWLEQTRQAEPVDTVIE
ncbi:cation:dicarboxylate symporter family transporter [Thiohalorhabdus sp.]|uniref:cation:dicarboxylate symporter family transporter n=1 Tax=Thiohalorhabdus sp. TaxID=3094134 RepID=UPI002FC2BBD2